MEKGEFLENIEDIIKSKGYYVATILPGSQPAMYTVLD